MKVLVFQHVPHESPGLLKKAAEQNGAQLEIIEFWKPYSIPNITNYEGLIILGGPMGVYDDEDKFPSKKQEVAAIKQAISKIPVIGFCLGSQLLAYALGAKVYPNMRGGKKLKEIGYYEVKLTGVAKTDPMLRDFASPLKVLQWHGDSFDLPQNAILLATSKDCTNQAFRYGSNAYGFLFHFEFTPEMIEKLIEVDKKWIHDGFELDEEKLKQQAKDNATLMEKQCATLFKNFLNLTANQ